MSALAEYLPIEAEMQPEYGPPLPALLRRHLQQSGMSQSEIARRAGLTQGVVSRVASGERRCRKNVILKLCRVLDLTDAERDRLLIVAGYAPSWCASTPVRDLVAVLRACPEDSRRNLAAQLATMRIRYNAD